MRRSVLNFFNVIDRGFARIIELLLLVILFAMGGLTVLQVVLRDFFGSGVPNAEIVSRHMVLWIAFLGAMLGTRVRSHISIDVVTRALPRRPRNAVRIFLDSVAFVVALLLAQASYHFVMNEKALGEILVGNFPAWLAQAVIPFGFTVIAVEYAIGVVLDIRRIMSVGDKHTAGDWRKYIST